jgi:hypothetical protein
MASKQTVKTNFTPTSRAMDNQSANPRPDRTNPSSDKEYPHGNRVTANKVLRDMQRKKSPGEILRGGAAGLKNRAVGILGTGLSNFKENYARSTTKDPGSNEGWLARGMRNFRDNNAMGGPAEHRGKKGKGRSRGGGGGPVIPFDSLNVDQGFSINPAFMNQGGLDLSMHPDPMYQHASRKKHSSGKGRGEGGRRVVVTRRTYYEDDRD